LGLGVQLFVCVFVQNVMATSVHLNVHLPDAGVREIRSVCRAPTSVWRTNAAFRRVTRCQTSTRLTRRPARDVTRSAMDAPTRYAYDTKRLSNKIFFRRDCDLDFRHFNLQARREGVRLVRTHPPNK